MLKQLPRNTFSNKVFAPDTNNPYKAVEYINSYIESTGSESMSVDISFMNIMDACYVSTMCSTNHYIKYPEGKINWFVSSNKTEELAKPLSLGNSEYFVTIS